MRLKGPKNSGLGLTTSTAPVPTPSPRSFRRMQRSIPSPQDSVGQPFGVLSFLSYSQTLVPPPSPLCRFSGSKRFPRCSSTTVGLRPLSRDISSGFSDSLFFPSALFNSLVRRLGTSPGMYSLEPDQFPRI